jgi:hypothetical protein
MKKWEHLYTYTATPTTDSQMRTPIRSRWESESNEKALRNICLPKPQTATVARVGQAALLALDAGPGEEIVLCVWDCDLRRVSATRRRWCGSCSGRGRPPVMLALGPASVRITESLRRPPLWLIDPLLLLPASGAGGHECQSEEKDALACVVTCTVSSPFALFLRITFAFASLWADPSANQTQTQGRPRI